MSSQITGQSAAETLRAVMAAEGLSNEQVAVDLLVNERTVRRWLAGETSPSRNTAKRLGLRFEIDWRLFCDELREAA